MALQVYEWKQFTGLADTTFIGQEGQFSNGSHNIECQTEPGLIKLTPALTDYLTTTDFPKFILDLTEYGDTGIYVFTKNGKIYKDGAPVYTLISGFKEIFGVVAQYDSGGTLYIYMDNGNSIMKANTSFSLVDETFLTPAQTNYGKNIFKNIYGTIYFSRGNVFYKFTNAGILSTIYTFPKEDKVTGISFYQDNFNLFTGNGTTSINGRQYVFSMNGVNATNSSPIANYLLDGLPVLGSTNSGSKDYLITGVSQSYSDLYIAGGGQVQMLKSNQEGSGYFRWFNGIITTRLKDVYIAGYGRNIDSTSSAFGVFRYGSYYPGQTEALQQIIKTTHNVTCLYASTDKLYIGTEANKVYTYSFNSGPLYNTGGYIYSLDTDLGLKYTKKAITQINIAYDCITNENSTKGGTITLALSLDGGTFYDVKTQTITNGSGVIEIFGPEILAYNSGAGMSNFTKMKLRVKLEPYNSGSGNYATPGFKGIQVIFDNGVKTIGN